MRKIISALLLGLFSPVLFAAQSASAADMKILTPPGPESPQGEISPEPSVHNPPRVMDIRPDGQTITLGVNLGTLLRLPGPARTVFVANEDVADVLVQQGRSELVYVTAKKAGSTVLYAADGAGHVLLNNVVRVSGGPVTIIHGSRQDSQEPPPAPNFFVLPFQPVGAAAASAPGPAPSPSR